MDYISAYLSIGTRLLLFATFSIITNANYENLPEKANKTYEKIIPCLKDNKVMSGRSSATWTFPIDAEAHYKQLLKLTGKYRNIPVHEAAGNINFVNNCFSAQFFIYIYRISWSMD